MNLSLTLQDIFSVISATPSILTLAGITRGPRPAPYDDEIQQHISDMSELTRRHLDRLRGEVQRLEDRGRGLNISGASYGLPYSIPWDMNPRLADEYRDFSRSIESTCKLLTESLESMIDYLACSAGIAAAWSEEIGFDGGLPWVQELADSYRLLLNMAAHPSDYDASQLFVLINDYLDRLETVLNNATRLNSSTPVSSG